MIISSKCSEFNFGEAYITSNTLFDGVKSGNIARVHREEDRWSGLIVMNLKHWSTKILDEGENARWSVNHSQSLTSFNHFHGNKEEQQRAAKQSFCNPLIEPERRSLGTIKIFLMACQSESISSITIFEKMLSRPKQINNRIKTYFLLLLQKAEFLRIWPIPNFNSNFRLMFWFHEKNIGFVTQCRNFMFFPSLIFHFE